MSKTIDLSCVEAKEIQGRWIGTYSLRDDRCPRL